MKRIVECVPNISEGRNEDIIKKICRSIENIKNVYLLNVEADHDYNRTVITFVGEPSNIVEAAYYLTETAVELIDMRKHKGEHPRIGAVDVVPFIPIKNVTMEECIELANKYGKLVAERLSVPVFLYEYAARTPSRKNLANIRKGEYERLAIKLKDPDWKPDYGEPIFNQKAGAIAVGARKLLIAYNINLNTSNVELADEIASQIRESGRIARNQQGMIIRNGEGNPIKIAGKFKSLKAIGVYLSTLDITQVSCNITDFEETSMHEVYEEVKRLASSNGVSVLGSELVGLVPLEALLKSGRFYAQDKKLNERGLILLAVEKLGLNQLKPFNPDKKIIEYLLNNLTREQM